MLWSGLSPVTRNLCCQSALGNLSGAVSYFPKAADDAYLQGQHTLKVQFVLGAWHSGLLHVGLKQHPARTGVAWVRGWPIVMPALSGEDVSLARAFPGPPLLGHSPLARPSFGSSSALSGQLHSCMHEVIYQGCDVVLESLFHGLLSEHVTG